MARVKTGDRVEWNAHGGTAEGKVVRTITKRTRVKGHTVAASKEDPQFLVETDEGKRAAHKPEALRKR
jgi:hypothetical protein